jgi:uncharacterized protein YjaG (DUF416 family)
MMDFNESALRRSLDKLPQAGQLAFILLICERLMPALEKFAGETGFRSARYRQYLNDAWRQLSGKSADSEYPQLAQACLDGAPDTENFDHMLTSAALSAALAVSALMSFLADHKVDHAVEAGRLAFDTSALYAESAVKSGPRSLSYDEMIELPLVQEELKRQADDLKFLASLRLDAARDVVPLIRERANGTKDLFPPR